VAASVMQVVFQLTTPHTTHCGTWAVSAATGAFDPMRRSGRSASRLLMWTSDSSDQVLGSALRSCPLHITRGRAAALASITPRHSPIRAPTVVIVSPVLSNARVVPKLQKTLSSRQTPRPSPQSWRGQPPRALGPNQIHDGPT
jgi:hypothetical protein